MLTVCIWAAAVTIAGVGTVAALLLISFANSELTGTSSDPLLFQLVAPVAGFAGLLLAIGAFATITRKVWPYVFLVASTGVLIAFVVYLTMS